MADLGELLEDELAGPPLVVGVHEAEQEHDGQRLGPELAQPADAAPHRVLVEGEQHLAGVVDPLGDGDAGAPAGDRRTGAG